MAGGRGVGQTQAEEVFKGLNALRLDASANYLRYTSPKLVSTASLAETLSPKP